MNPEWRHHPFSELAEEGVLALKFFERNDLHDNDNGVR
jgi:hypothetical protein